MKKKICLANDDCKHEKVWNLIYLINVLSSLSSNKLLAHSAGELLGCSRLVSAACKWKSPPFLSSVILKNNANMHARRERSKEGDFLFFVLFLCFFFNSVWRSQGSISNCCINTVPITVCRVCQGASLLFSVTSSEIEIQWNSLRLMFLQCLSSRVRPVRMDQAGLGARFPHLWLPLLFAACVLGELQPIFPPCGQKLH